MCSGMTIAYDPKPDKKALIDALWQDRFNDLEHMLGAMESAASKDGCSDRPMALAFRTFNDVDPYLEPRLDDWVRAFPHSAFALAARGKYFANRGYKARGARWASETSDAQFKAMNAEFERAAADLSEAIKLDPKLPLPASQFLGIIRNGGTQEMGDAAFERYMRLMPYSYVIRETYATELEPKWGGDARKMFRMVNDAAALASHNPDLALLPSVAGCLLAEDWRRAGHPEEGKALRLDITRRYAGKIAPSCDQPKEDQASQAK